MITPGLYQIRIPIPIRSLGEVFSYLVTDSNHNLLIDCGWPSDEAYSCLETSLQALNLEVKDIEQVVVSHLHPDHFGLVEQIKDRSRDVKVIMLKADADQILNSYEEYGSLIDELHNFLAEHGTPEEELKVMLEASVEMLRFFRPPKPTDIVTGGEKVRVGEKWSFEVIPTPGHTIGTMCLYDRGSQILFSGDHVLPTITPNVSLGPRYADDPLGDYLNSLERVNKLQALQVLPSHEYVFTSLQKRVGEIKQHHNERLAEALSIIVANSQSVSGYHVASKLHWYSGRWEELGPWERRAAVMETLAHLDYLRRQGKLRMTSELAGSKNLIRFEKVS